MDVPLTTVFVLLIAASCGAIGQTLAGGGKGGLIPSVFLGLVGALAGPWLALQLRLSEPFVLDLGGESIALAWSIAGSALCVSLLHIVSGRGYRAS